MGLPCAIGVIILSKDLILVIAGESFLDAAPVLQILMIGFTISLVGGNFFGNAVLLPSKQEKKYMIICCVCALINSFMNYMLIPLWGAKAAAGTTSLCSLIILIMSIIKVDKCIKIQKWWKLLIAPLVGCICIVIVCLFLSRITNLYLRCFLSVALSAVVYCVIQIVLKNSLAYEALEWMRIRKKLDKGIN